MSPENVIYGYKDTLGNASNIGKNLVKQGNHKMPSLRSQEKFTERFKKPLEFFLNELNIPDYIKLNFFEDNPYNVRVEVIVDWLGLIKSKEDLKNISTNILRDSNKALDFIATPNSKEVFSSGSKDSFPENGSYNW